MDVKSLSPVGEIIPEPGFPRGVSITPDGSKALVVNQNVDYITIIDLQASPPVVSGQITLPNPLAPAAIDIAPDGQTAVVSDALRTVVYIIDVHSQTVTNTINLPSLAQNNLSVEITPDSSRALLGMTTGVYDSLGIIDLTNSPPTLEFVIPVDASFQDISVTPDGTTALLSLGGDTGDTPKIAIVDLTSSPPAVTWTIPLESTPAGIEVTSDGSLTVVVLTGDLPNIPGNQPRKLLILNLKPTIPDADGDGIPDDQDACPEEDATGFDTDQDGCIDNLTGLNNMLETLVNQGVIDTVLKNSLLSKVLTAEKSADKENIDAAINKLEALIHEINAQRGKKISEDAAAELIVYTESIINWLSNQLT